jgi:hypothetical protein
MSQHVALSHHISRFQARNDRIPVGRAPHIRLNARASTKGLEPRPLRRRHTTVIRLELDEQHVGRSYHYQVRKLTANVGLGQTLREPELLRSSTRRCRSGYRLMRPPLKSVCGTGSRPLIVHLAPEHRGHTPDRHACLGRWNAPDQLVAIRYARIGRRSARLGRVRLGCRAIPAQTAGVACRTSDMLC